ncbi:MAG TPA: alkaline phosphatase family protein [Acidimicrobiales bacterium]|jgi:phospholipase C|nr:alkaline phosphatase family protein [Acidimicrobiales bacterium]
MSEPSASRRRLLQAGSALAIGGFAGSFNRRHPAVAATLDGNRVAARARVTRHAGSRPHPDRAVGTPDPSLPFDHIVIVMQENHSFDNYFGMLPVRGQPAADGFRFDHFGRALDVNPVQPGQPARGYIRSFRNDGPCQEDGITQAWNATHHQIDGGRMDGFIATSGPPAMSYLDEPDIPFYYSLAKTFTLANRWFCSAPCQTYPNRRFLMAGTAYGLVSTDVGSILDPPPPNGTIWDRLSAAGLSWRNYFTDLPSTGIIANTIERHPLNLAPLAQFHADCAAGTLPAVSLVDPDFNAGATVLGEAQSLPGVDDVAKALGPGLAGVLDFVRAQGASEENPDHVTFGEAFVHGVVQSVLHGPAWHRTLLVWTYDEHGGYYDHVPPPAAIVPDKIRPVLQPTDVQGNYDIYGPRVPAVVVSPYSRPHGVTNEVYDHTSILATIEAKWNLPALTARDANANTLAGFLGSTPRLLRPPKLAAPADLVAGDLDCQRTQHPPVISSPTAPFPAGHTAEAGKRATLPAPLSPLGAVTEATTEVLGKLGF